MAFTFDGPTKRINISAATTISLRDLWSRWVDWVLASDNSKYLQAFTQVGGNDIDLSAGTYIPIYLFLSNGWRIKPQESNHTLNVQDGVLVVDGGGDPFVNTTGSYVVRINYQQPVQAISFSTAGGGGGLTIDQDSRLTRIEKFLRNKRITDPVTGKQTVFDDDNATVLGEGDLFEDVAGSQPYRGQGAERAERLA